MDTAVITGAGSGIGRETAALLASRGHKVVAADIDLASAEATVASIVAAGGDALAYRIDVADEQQWLDFADWVEREAGAAAVLINNAGVMNWGGFVDTPVLLWQRTVEVDLMSVIYGCRVFAQRMIEAGIRGHIVNVASAAGFLPHKAVPAYGVAKAAVVLASQSLRAELRSSGIGVGVICPGVVRTNLIANGQRANLSDNERDRWYADAGAAQAKISAGPEKVARVIEKSIRRNWAVVPVNAEAWIAYVAHRAAPSLCRRIVNTVSLETADGILPKLTRDAK